jgi:adenylate cyclase
LTVGDERDPASGDTPSSLELVPELVAAIRSTLEEPRPFALEEVAEEAGIDVEELRRLFDAARRVHDDGGYGRRDVDYARGLAELRAGFDVDVLERAMRVNQRAVTTIVVNQLALTQLDRRLAPVLATERWTPQVAELAAAESRDRVATVQRLLVSDHHEALLRLLESQVVAEASTSLGEVLDVAVAFVDLVGFTRLSASVEPAAVGELLAAFENVSHHEAQRAGEVIVVKLIGDAVMLLGGDAAEVADAALGIVEARSGALDDVARRAGLAAGQVQVRDGDYVGTPVNLAARLTDLARPGTLVAAPGMEERLGEDWRHSRLPVTKVKGLGRLRPLRVRRTRSPDDA